MEFYHRNHLKLLECIGFYSYLLVYRPKLVSIKSTSLSTYNLTRADNILKLAPIANVIRSRNWKKKKELQVKLIGCLSWLYQCLANFLLSALIFTFFRVFIWLHYKLILYCISPIQFINDFLKNLIVQLLKKY